MFKKHLSYNGVANNSISDDNKGFSLVEVLVAMFVLSIVFTPVLKSFMTAAITNSKAQKMQSATSLAESVMEEVKSNSIQNLFISSIDTNKKPDFAKNTGSTIEFYSDNNFTTPITDGALFNVRPNPQAPYQIKYYNVAATQGQTYDVVVDITSEEYNIEKDRTLPDATNPDPDDVSNANTWILPELGLINAVDNAVISWEINKYDSITLNDIAYANANNISEYDTIKNAIKGPSGNGVKTVQIDIDDFDADRIEVSCTVSYSSGLAAYPHDAKYVVYTETFNRPAASVSRDSGIYIFYTTSYDYFKLRCAENSSLNPTLNEYYKTEKLIINNHTSDRKQNIYFMLQKKWESGEKIALNHGDSKLDIKVTGYGGGNLNIGNSDSITQQRYNLTGANINDIDSLDDNMLYTNLYVNGTNYDPAHPDEKVIGDVYTKYKKDKIYNIKVTVYSHGDTTDKRAELTSTVQSGKEAY